MSQATLHTSNGAIVVDLATREIRRQRLLETEVAVRLVRALRERMPGIRFAVEHEAFAHEPGFSAWNWTPRSPTTDASVSNGCRDADADTPRRTGAGNA